MNNIQKKKIISKQSKKMMHKFVKKCQHSSQEINDADADAEYNDDNNNDAQHHLSNGYDETEPEPAESTEPVQAIDVNDEMNINANGNGTMNEPNEPDTELIEVTEPLAIQLKKPYHFHHTKQHTGLKNISFNVGAAVSPTDKMEFDQERPESFGLLKINRPIGRTHTNLDRFDTTLSGMSPTHQTGDGLTDQGYFDLKFHHNKLW